MKPFMDETFLLNTPTAQHLYDAYAKTMPIIDYHCHIIPRQIAEDHRFATITEAWLGGDHYKWRAMRAQGIDEHYITGDASDWEKFEKWASIMPMLIGNPLYHWTHLELKRYFDIHEPLSAANARQVYDACNAKLQEDGMTVRGLITQSGVTCLCSTDDPADTLEWHKAIAEDTTFKTRVLPGWRPDKALNIEKAGFVEYIAALSEAAGVKIASFNDLCEALRIRLEVFHALGCCVSDHGVTRVPFADITDEEADAALKTALAGGELTQRQIEGYRTRLMVALGKEYVKHGWVMQIHYGALRNNNPPMFKKLGPDTGYDSVGDAGCGQELASLLGTLQAENALSKTVVFSLNPNDNAMISAILGCFWDSAAVGKMQLGAAWWFNDTKPGMINQLVDYAATAVLGNFIGMLTDSRSFLSYTRHEYFRRILCNLIGEWVEKGEYPNDENALKTIIEGVCYKNAVAFLGLEGTL